MINLTATARKAWATLQTGLALPAYSANLPETDDGAATVTVSRLGISRCFDGPTAASAGARHRPTEGAAMLTSHEEVAGSAMKAAKASRVLNETDRLAMFAHLQCQRVTPIGEAACSCRGRLNWATCADWRWVFFRIEGRAAAWTAGVVA